MGHFMAANLVRAGFPLTVWNRTAERADRPGGARARRKRRRPRKWRGQVDIVVACLTDSPQVEAVLFGEEGLDEGFSEGLAVH